MASTPIIVLPVAEPGYVSTRKPEALVNYVRARRYVFMVVINNIVMIVVQSANVIMANDAVAVKRVPEDPFAPIKNSEVAVKNVVAKKYASTENAVNYA